jgi:hypothetical protein
MTVKAPDSIGYISMNPLQADIEIKKFELIGVM